MNEPMSKPAKVALVLVPLALLACIAIGLVQDAGYCLPTPSM